jgi:hypothetical protein
MTTVGQPTSGNAQGELLRDLIKAEFAGKDAAIAAYNTFKWKIRAGYIAIVYALLAFAYGRESGLKSLVENPGNLVLVGGVIVVLSITAFALDFSYTSKKALVIVARDTLVKKLLAPGEHEEKGEDLATLLGISGESDPEVLTGHRKTEFRRIRRHEGWTWAWIYVPAPLALFALWLLLP